MDKNQETQAGNDFSQDQTGIGAGEPEGTQVNGGESELSLLLKEVVGIKTTLTNLEIGQTKMDSRLTNLEIGQTKMDSRLTNLEIGQTKMDSRLTNLEIGQKVLDVKVTAFGTQVDGYNDKIAGQDAKIAGQDSKVDAAIIKTDAQDTKFESQDKLIAGHDSKIESQNNQIAAQDAKIENAGFNTLHKIIAIIIAAIIFLMQVWAMLPESVKEFLTFGGSDATKSFLLFLGFSCQRYKIFAVTTPFRSIKLSVKCAQNL